MEIANLERAKIRPATDTDAQQILQLMNEAPYTHIHADWHVPGDWLGTPGFVVFEDFISSESFAQFGRVTPGLTACLAVAADPHPAAWVRLAAIRRRPLAQEILAGMVEAVIPFLEENGITEVGWLAVESWPDEILPSLGFRRANWITTFVKEGVDIPAIRNNGVEIRPVEKSDMIALADIEADAFDPLWRHSDEGLRLALGHAICFDVALVDGRMVGFQYSTVNYNGKGAHLVRITVRPDMQGYGVGSVLMKSAFEAYRRQGIKRVSLNTQLNNVASHRLYEKFGFIRTGDQIPVWVLAVGRGLG